jgi:DNA polymerase-1
MKEKKLFLLDAYALIFRAYYAFIRAQMFNSKGLNTSAIFGFTATLEEILRTEYPTHIGVVFDPPGPTFRHEKFPEYKANREATPEEIKLSVPWIKKVLEAFNIPVIEIQGYEADDVIGTLASKAAGKGFSVYMMTPDKDYAQLVSEHIFMYKPRRSGNIAEIMGPREISESFSVDEPKQVIDVLALWGDSSDNVPGAPGIGEKTSKKLIAQFKSVENLLEHMDELKGKIRESIQRNREQILLSKDLVTIRLDVPVEFNEAEMEYGGAKPEELVKLFQELEFKTLAERILREISPGKTEGESTTAAQADNDVGGNGQGDLFQDSAQVLTPYDHLKTLADVEHHYTCVNTREKALDLAGLLSGLKAFCFDTETTDINAIDAELVGMSFSWESNRAWYVPFPETRDEARKLLELFSPALEDQGVLKIGQNLKYDIQVLRNYGINVSGHLFDTMIAHYLLLPEQRHGLDAMAEAYLGYRNIPTEDLIGKKGATQENMRNVPLEKICDYACEDADVTWKLYGILKSKLKEINLAELAERIEFPLVPVLCSMEEAGIKLDSAALKKYAGTLKTELIELRDNIYELAGEEFNISSPRQLGDILFEKLKISSDAKKTKTKQYSTSEDVLIRLTYKHPIVNKVLEYRTITKLLSTYVEALPRMVNPRTGYIHTSYNQAVTATGRLSSNNPNLQNIPIREAKGREIRKAFVPREEDFIFLSADYSQIELRLMAHMSGDALMKEAFQKGEDIHASTASKIFNCPLEEVTREQRSQAKTANFGIIYGISAFGLSQRMQMSRTQAKELIDNYFSTHSRVRKYMDECIAFARDTGYVETMLGRRRYLRDIHSRNAVVRGFAERNAINAPIQGSAADIIKIAMIRIQKNLENAGSRSKMILQVHDELVFDVYRHELDKIRAMVVEEMEKAYELSVPLVVDHGIGSNWLEAH